LPQRISNMIGRRYTRLVVLRENGHNKYGMRMFECQCDCGNIVNVPISSLQNGTTKSCGCIRNKYGYSPVKNSKLYKVWTSMKERCSNPNDKAYHNYGGRGIIVCDLWKNDYGCFMDWAYQNGYREGLTLDRINNNGPYSPDNCRWTTRIEQSNNIRNNRWITYNNETHTISQWARNIGIKPNTLQLRLKKWPLERALTEAPHKECVRF